MPDVPPTLPSYLDRLCVDLDAVATRVADLLHASTIVPDSLNEPGSGVVFITAADWQWGPSTPQAQSFRMSLDESYSEWITRVRLLFEHPTPEVASEFDDLDRWVRGWIDRNTISDFSIPSTIGRAQAVAAERIGRFRALLELAGAGGTPGLRIVPDTNALIKNPDLESYSRAFDGASFTAHILPTVLGELDDLKDQGKTQELRDKAQGVIRRFKGLRSKGSLADGVTLTRRITVVAESREVDASTVLSWLDSGVPDDRIVASALRLQSQHPANTVVLVTSDLNLQNKADAARLPYIETPKSTEDLTARFEAAITWEIGDGGTGPLLTVKNTGRVPARKLEYSIGDPPGTPGTTWTAGPWHIAKLAPGATERQAVVGPFTMPTLFASWTDDTGAHDESWPLDFPPKPSAPQHRAPRRIR